MVLSSAVQLVIQGPVPSDGSTTPSSSQVYLPSSTRSAKLAVAVVGVRPQLVEQVVSPATAPARRTPPPARTPFRRAPDRPCAASRPANTTPPSRTAPRRCRRSGRGTPAGTRVSPATGPCRRRSAGPVFRETARRTGGVSPAGRTRRTTSAPFPFPPQVVAATSRRTRSPSRRRRPWPAGRVGRGEVAGRGQVRVDRLPRDQQVHDLGRALEDPVDPQIAQDLLRRYGALTAGGE